MPIVKWPWMQEQSKLVAVMILLEYVTDTAVASLAVLSNAVNAGAEQAGSSDDSTGVPHWHGRRSSAETVCRAEWSLLQ